MTPAGYWLTVFSKLTGPRKKVESDPFPPPWVSNCRATAQVKTAGGWGLSGRGGWVMLVSGWFMYYCHANYCVTSGGSVIFPFFSRSAIIQHELAFFFVFEFNWITRRLIFKAPFLHNVFHRWVFKISVNPHFPPSVSTHRFWMAKTSDGLHSHRFRCGMGRVPAVRWLFAAAPIVPPKSPGGQIPFIIRWSSSWVFLYFQSLVFQSVFVDSFLHFGLIFSCFNPPHISFTAARMFTKGFSADRQDTKFANKICSRPQNASFIPTLSNARAIFICIIHFGSNNPDSEKCNLPFFDFKIHVLCT